MSRKYRSRRLILSGIMAILTVGAVGIVMSGTGRFPSPIVGEVDPTPSTGETAAFPVKIIRPIRDPSFRIAVRRLAQVEAFYEAHLYPQTSGVVNFVGKEIGEPVYAGELLVSIDVPDSVRELEHKESIVRQRERELELARTQLKVADANIKIAEAKLLQRETDVDSANALMQFRQKRLSRLQLLASREAIGSELVEEQEQHFLAAQAAQRSAQAAVLAAKADLSDALAKRESAEASVRLGQAMVEVARREVEKARVAVELGQIRAPFDGVIVRRRVDPGSVIRSGTSEPILVIARLDLVTVSAKIPDDAAPFVSRDSEVEIRIDKLPGITLRGRVTRMQRSIDPLDRTMRIEVDLFIGDDVQYRKFIARRLQLSLIPLTGGFHWPTLGLLKITDPLINPDCKGVGDRLPSRPMALRLYGKDRLLPNSTGEMTVYLSEFGIPGLQGLFSFRGGRVGGYLIPASAVFNRGGRRFIFLVENNIARMVPVRVQVTDGRLSKIVMLVKNENEEVFAELTGNESIIAARQAEIHDGMHVEPISESSP